MTEKVCASCGTYIEAGRYCPQCGQQLYPDVGKTIWIRLSEKPKFDVWTGEAR